jgi:tetratricopeptide (TPR) repeat protein
VEAEREASRAFQLDPQNSLALAYYAEILADEQKWTQAEKYAAQAVAQDPESMDTHRVYGYVLETLGKYNSAIQQYQEAARINPI